MKITKVIKSENIEFIYDNSFDYRLFKDDYVMSHTHDILDFVNISEIIDFCRVCISQPVFNSTKPVIDYLFWMDDTNLIELDEKVLNNTFTDDDFVNSIRTGFIKNLRCSQCNHIYKGGLRVDSVLGYIGNLSLGRLKINAFRGKDRFLKCPNCNGNFRQMILHIFE
jgi:uncharacterized C2H2 Zn-finger protein